MLKRPDLRLFTGAYQVSQRLTDVRADWRVLELQASFYGGEMAIFAFLLTSTAILLTPGPTNTVLATCGAAFGVKRAAVMPVAEALGYLIAISGFTIVSDYLRGNDSALFAVKLAASIWLLYSARQLWTQATVHHLGTPKETFFRVFVTTLVNPKAMLVGTVIIPPAVSNPWVLIVTYAGLSLTMGLLWVLLGASMPRGIKRHAYKIASLVLSGFSFAAALSAFVS